jgi:hypothetical protein
VVSASGNSCPCPLSLPRTPSDARFCGSGDAIGWEEVLKRRAMVEIAIAVLGGFVIR